MSPQTSSFSSWFHGIKGKLLFAAVLPLIGFGIVFGISMNAVSTLQNIIHTSQVVVVPNLQAIGDMRGNRLNFNLSIAEALDHENMREDSTKKAARYLNGYLEAYKSYTDAAFLDGEDVVHNAAKEDIQAVISAMKELVAHLETNQPERIQTANILFREKMPTLNRLVLTHFNDKVEELYSKKIESEKTLAATTEKNIKLLLTLIIGASGLTIFCVLLLIAAKISKSLLVIAHQLSDSSLQVAAAVEQLNGAGNALSSSSTEAAASLEETVASLTEMTTMVKTGADHAKQAASLTISSRDSAETGAKEIQNLIESMNQISVSSKKIEEIISVIDDIAFQTNLLALNAAVEAARAGEQGKGFAVVAEAVRSLAQRSSTSAKDISSLIKDSVAQIEEGSAIADKSGTILANIVNSIKKVSDLNNEIATASIEQATGIEQINKAMNQLDQAGQSNAASAEEIAATSGQVSSLATATQELTAELNAIVLGSGQSTLSPETNRTQGRTKIKHRTHGHSAASEAIPFEPKRNNDFADAGNF